MASRPRPASSSTHTSEVSKADTGVSQLSNTSREGTSFDPFQRQALMFTGPDGLRNHRVKVEPSPGFVGEGDTSKERTGALSYLFRSAEGTPFPLAKHGRLGEIGTEVDMWKIKKGI